MLYYNTKNISPKEESGYIMVETSSPLFANRSSTYLVECKTFIVRTNAMIGINEATFNYHIGKKVDVCGELHSLVATKFPDIFLILQYKPRDRDVADR